MEKLQRVTRPEKEAKCLTYSSEVEDSSNVDRDLPETFQYSDVDPKLCLDTEGHVSSGGL